MAKADIRNNVRRFRFEHGEMSQQELADRVGCTRQTIIALEQGKYVPSLSLLLQEEIGGQAVKEYLPTPQAAWALRRMAAALSKLHRTPAPLEKPWGFQEHLTRCHPPATTLAATVPAPPDRSTPGMS